MKFTVKKVVMPIRFKRQPAGLVLHFNAEQIYLIYMLHDFCQPS